MRFLNKLFLVFAFPVAIFLWPIGWSLFWIGSQKKDKN